MADFAASVLAKALVMLVESLVSKVIQAAFANAFGPTKESAMAFA
ncbi:hypothetical protein [Carbonactinospora thermoautotrophica]|uniref:Uncharacterized protein n=1 Tax=Carbonactinospora thermoautotrophica TaxID=1469144 RepID=A0A132MLI7_9ACTN|nr:hypothetical protein [Carbonactinospora thermoautotrophica]KWW98724.1 hypothetical protein LI90_353 [Carbonactinospora thermoautotrophica]